MKYISKNSNLMVVLRTGIPGNAQLGTSSTPGLYVRFKDGIADIENEDTNLLMQKSPAFNVDFVMVEENAIDPYASARVSIEPTHTLKEIKYGHVEKTITDKPAFNLPPEVMKYIQSSATSLAIEMAKEMLPGMVRETLKSMAAGANTEAVVSEKEEGVEKEEKEEPKKTVKPEEKKQDKKK